MITIIGVDCATRPNKVGLARARWHGATAKAEIIEARIAGRQLNELLRDWVRDGGPTLLALDSPLAWPCRLAQALLDHRPGEPISEDASRLFRRETDKVVTKEIGVRPLDVGADRIARTTHASLGLLAELRSATQQPIPVAWAPSDLNGGAAAIEVYPAATLRALRLPHSSYKKPQQRAEREQILEGLRQHLQLSCDRQTLLATADALDAVVCVQAGCDFLAGAVIPPTDNDLARQEGWIWVRRPDSSEAGGSPTGEIT